MLDRQYLDAESRHFAFFRGLPEMFGIRYLADPQLYLDERTGSRFIVIAEHYPVFFRLALDNEGTLWTVGPGDRSSFVNSSLGTFGKSLYALLELKAPLDDAENRGNIIEFERLGKLLEAELREIDPKSLDDDSNWWSNCIKDI